MDCIWVRSADTGSWLLVIGLNWVYCLLSFGLLLLLHVDLPRLSLYMLAFLVADSVLYHKNASVFPSHSSTFDVHDPVSTRIGRSPRQLLAGSAAMIQACLE